MPDVNIHLSPALQAQHLSLPIEINGLQQQACQLLATYCLRGRPVSIVLLTDTEMAVYNQSYRQKQGPTNVLAFPASGETAELGDILISLDTAQREAKAEQLSLSTRVSRLLVHGFLHLIGFDHERSGQEAEAMWDLEEKLLQDFSPLRKKKMTHLAINVDHVATLREARGINEPDPVIAAGICELAGAAGIVVHLREDRRHIQDRDVYLLRETIKTKLNLEMATTKEIVNIALDVDPDMVTLVPEKRLELTTEGGLDLLKKQRKVAKTIEKMQKANIPVSLFIDPDAVQIEAAKELGATFVELHTGCYCDAWTEADREREFRLLETGVALAVDSGLRVNAGHGLDYQTTAKIAALPGIEELSIGHAVISRAVYVGLDQAVREMALIIKESNSQT